MLTIYLFIYLSVSVSTSNFRTGVYESHSVQGYRLRSTRVWCKRTESQPWLGDTFKKDGRTPKVKSPRNLRNLEGTETRLLSTIGQVGLSKVIYNSGSLFRNPGTGKREILQTTLSICFKDGEKGRWKFKLYYFFL